MNPTTAAQSAQSAHARTVQPLRELADPTDFKTLMSGFPTGVSIVTALDAGGTPWGMTCSSLCSVSVEPPTLVVGMRAQSPTQAAVVSGSRFTVNFLHSRARATAELFASGDPDRFQGTAWCVPDGSAGPHLTEAAQTVADCRVSMTVPVGTMRMVFGEVYRISELREMSPLLYGLRRFSSWPMA